MFVVQWDGEDAPVSLMIDALTEDDARDVAKKIHPNDEPDRVIKTPPNFFIAELVTVEGQPLPKVEPLDWVLEVLDVIEEHGGAKPEDFEAPAEDAEVCGEEADTDDGVVACDLARGHDGTHQAETATGVFDW